MLRSKGQVNNEMNEIRSRMEIFSKQMEIIAFKLYTMECKSGK